MRGGSGGPRGPPAWAAEEAFLRGLAQRMQAARAAAEIMGSLRVRASAWCLLLSPAPYPPPPPPPLGLRPRRARARLLPARVLARTSLTHR